MGHLLAQGLRTGKYTASEGPQVLASGDLLGAQKRPLLVGLDVTPQLPPAFDTEPAAKDVEAHIIRMARYRDEVSELQDRKSQPLSVPTYSRDSLVFVRTKKPKKLTPPWRGPFVIVAPSSERGMSYQVAYPDGTLFKHKIHIQDLKLFVPRSGLLSDKPKTYFIADYDLSTFDLGVAEEPCGQRNFPRTVQQLVELALSTFGQKWPPTAIQIYSRTQITWIYLTQIPGSAAMPIIRTDISSFGPRGGAANLKAAIRPDASKDIPDQTLLKLEYDLDALTRVHLRERERHMLLVSSGKTLASFPVWDRPSDYSSCPWEDLTGTSYTSTLSPLQPCHVSVLLFFSFQGVPQLSWAINLYSVAAKGSLKAFVQYLMTAADLRPYKLYESSVGEPESTALLERQMLLI
ncbi:hypothetical protein MferCBS49748_004276 [Microsporum ferrugineum]